MADDGQLRRTIRLAKAHGHALTVLLLPSPHAIPQIQARVIDPEVAGQSIESSLAPLDAAIADRETERLLREARQFLRPLGVTVRPLPRPARPPQAFPQSASPTDPAAGAIERLAS